MCPWAAARPLAVCSRVLLLVAPLVFRAPEGPAAREARRPHFVRRRASKPARALRTLRRPPHQWGWVADVCSARRLEARTGPATAHGRCGQALPTRRPGCLKPLSPLLAGTRVGLKPPLLLLARARVGLKPPSPLRAPGEPRLKPSSPLRVRNGRFWCIFRAQRCRRFQWSLDWGRAVVMVVSMVAAQGRAVVLSVSKSPWAGSRVRKSSPRLV